MLYGRNGTDHTRMHARQKREAKRALHDGIHEHAFPSPRSTRVPTSLASAQAPSRRRVQGQVLRPFMADRVALQKLRQPMEILVQEAQLTARLPSPPPGLGPSGATSALNPSAEEFLPLKRQQVKEEESSSGGCSTAVVDAKAYIPAEWWMQQLPLEFWGPQQLLESRLRVKYRPPPPKGICRWCERKTAVSRRRCEDCQTSDDAKKTATDARSEEERARMRLNNLRRKGLPGAKIRNFKYQQTKRLQVMQEELQKKYQQCHQEMQEQLQKDLQQCHQEMQEQLQKGLQQYHEELSTRLLTQQSSG